MKWLSTLLVLWACVIPLNGYASQRSPQPPNPEGSEDVAGEEVDNTVIVINEAPAGSQEIAEKPEKPPVISNPKKRPPKLEKVTRRQSSETLLEATDRIPAHEGPGQGVTVIEVQAAPAQ